MLQGFVKLFGGNPNKKEIEKITAIVAQTNALEAEYEKHSDDVLRAKTDEFRRRLLPSLGGIEGGQESLDDILPETFAAVREASKRTIGLRHYDVQLIGGVVLHRGMIAEMRTGEGKTLVATLPLYLNALTGKGCHLITVNDYLARRDARWMGPIYAALGLTVGILQMAAVTENGKKAFLYDPEREHSREDQDQMRMVDRREAYAADITYGTNAEFGFDYLRDNMVYRLEDKVQRGHHYAIVDEVDNVLIDEARTPLIISGPASGDVEWYGKMAQIVRQLKTEDYEVEEKDRTVSLTEIGTAHVEQLLAQPLRDPDRPEDVTPEQARLFGYLEQALRAQHLFRRNKDYLVQAGKVVIVDEFTGRLMPGRRWSDGLHQAVEAKEGARVEPENVTYATITLQNYFRMYAKLAGMTGTALTEAEEFSKIYKLEVLPIPTNLEYQAFGPAATLVEVKTRDEDGFEYFYFARNDDSKKNILFWRRKDFPDVIYRTVEAKLRAIVREIFINHVKGRPLLVGTTSVESSERISNRLRAEPIRRLMQILLIRHAWMEANNRVEDGRAIPELESFNTSIDKLRTEDLRPMAKELGLSLNPEDPANLSLLRDILHLEESDEVRLKSVLQGGVANNVLNARKHTEESMIIAGAGAFGAVTIATNMAGRGVDIKLGGEVAEEILSAVNRVLRKAGYEDPYDMNLQERRTALQKTDLSLFGIYETEVKYFLKYFLDMERIRELGGLHVIGSERHEARRIDNQLRGRSARQGDSGSSRFFLSLEDDLMRIFGGEQVKTMMERFHLDDDFPLQARMVSGIIEQSQHRVEGANFDVRKHLLEYDDVLNAQRMRIYAQRDRVFEKEDLSEDVSELLRQEIQRRVKEANESGEIWRLLAWLEQIQPIFPTPKGAFPSFTYKVLLDKLNATKSDIKSAILDIAQQALQTDRDHLQQLIQEQIDSAGESLKNQIEERMDTLDTFFDAMRENEDSEARRPQQLIEELNSTMRMPLRMNNEQMQKFSEDPFQMKDALEELVIDTLSAYVITRLIANFEFRLGEPLGLNLPDLQSLAWDDITDQIFERVQFVLNDREKRLLGEDGQIAGDLEAALERMSEPIDDQAKLRLLVIAAQSARTYFDVKTHRQMKQAFLRLHYFYLVDEILANVSSERLEEDILNHLQQAQAAQQLLWGESEWTRQGGKLVSDSEVTDLGRRIQTQIYRQVLLGSITELWVDYLTRVEALRVSVGLEAYAQRDPLVQYKSQASEMFQNLLVEIRAAVIGRIFLVQPRPTTTNRTENARGDAQSEKPLPASEHAQNSGKKRKRHRH